MYSALLVFSSLCFFIVGGSECKASTNMCFHEQYPLFRRVILTMKELQWKESFSATRSVRRALLCAPFSRITWSVTVSFRWLSTTQAFSGTPVYSCDGTTTRYCLERRRIWINHGESQKTWLLWLFPRSSWLLPPIRTKPDFLRSVEDCIPQKLT